LKQGRYDESRRLFERALAIQERALGRDHPDVARSLDGLASVTPIRGDRRPSRSSSALRQYASARSDPVTPM
jgi:hypothetical protein